VIFQKNFQKKIKIFLSKSEEICGEKVRIFQNLDRKKQKNLESAVINHNSHMILIVLNYLFDIFLVFI